jgi:hypothetical protein
VYYFLPSTSQSSHFGFERSNGVTILFTYVFLDVFTEHDEWVVVLFHATLGALDTGLEPFHDALLMKHVFAP